MNFWERVNLLLDEKDINKKTLAAEAGFSQSNITKGVKDNNIPSAETAVKIAKILGVTVEYLVTGEKVVPKQGELKISEPENRYSSFIKVVDSLPVEDRQMLFHLVNKLKK